MVQTGRVRWNTWVRMVRAAKRSKARKAQHPKPASGFLSNIDAYARQVILYYNLVEHREFKQLIGEAADRLETKNQSDTVLCVLRTLA